MPDIADTSDSSYVIVSSGGPESNLPNKRTLAVGSSKVTLTDGGAGSTASIDTPNAAQTNTSNTFTAAQTIQKDTSAVLTLYRDVSTIDQDIYLNFDAKDSGSTQGTVGRIDVYQHVNTAGSEDGVMGLAVVAGGAMKTLLELDKNGAHFGETARRITMSDANCSTDRIYTTPDIAGRVKVQVHDYFEHEDEFSCGSISNTNTSNQIGTLGWGTSTAGTSAPVVTAGVASHPGIVTLTTGATSGNNNRLHLTDAANTAWCDPTDLERWAWIVRVPTITSVSVRIGIGQDLSSTTFGTAGAWFSFDAAVDSHWQTITRQASTSTTNTSTVTVNANDWFLLEAVRLSGGNWEFYINNSLKFTHSANLPTTACNIGCMVQTATTAARTLGVDWFKLRTKILGQRWT